MKLKPPFQLNVPMVLTWARIAMIPLVMGIFYFPDQWIALRWQNVIACVIFVAAAATDGFDGYLARRYEGWATRMGAFLDPIADKLLVSAALVTLVALDRCDMAVAMIIIGREIAVTGLREWMAKIGESGLVKVNWFGKSKTIAQMTAIPCLLWNDPFYGIPVGSIGTVLIWIAAILTIYSMYVYMRAAGPYFDETRAANREARLRRADEGAKRRPAGQDASPASTVHAP